MTKTARSARRSVWVGALALGLAFLPAGTAAAALPLGPGDILMVGGGGDFLYHVDPMTGAQTVLVSGFSNTTGVAIEADGDLLVADGSFVIRIDGETGERTTAASGFGKATAVAVEADGDILATDPGNLLEPGSAVLVRIDRVTGARTTLSKGGSFAFPNGIAVEADGDILVSDDGRSGGLAFAGVIRVDPVTGTQTVVSNGSFPARFPAGIAVEADGDILVTTPASGDNAPMLVRIDPVTGQQVVVAEFGDSPRGVALEADGDVLVADPRAFNGGGAVFRVDPVTGAVTTASQGGAFASPVAVAVVPAAPNSPPVAVDDAYTIIEDTPLGITAPGVLGNDTDADGDTVTAAATAGPSHGTVRLDPDGSFTYTPTAGYSGPDSFTYTATDGTASSNVATVALTVNPVDDPPAAVADAYRTTEDTPLTVAAPGVLGNDTDADSRALAAALTAGPGRGSVTLGSDGGFTYTPAPDASGGDSFSYTVSDGTTTSGPTTVTLTVDPVDDPPVLPSLAPVTATATGPAGAVVTYPTPVATDVDGPAPTVGCSPASGTVFPPGTTTVTCTATGPQGGTATGTFPVTVSFALGTGLRAPVNPAAVNTVKAGATVPLRFQVPTSAGGFIRDTAIVTRFTVTRIDCASLTAQADPVELTTTGGTVLRYDTSTEQFVQNWKTPNTPGSCQRVQIALVGGQALMANFQLT